MNNPPTTNDEWTTEPEPTRTTDAAAAAAAVEKLSERWRAAHAKRAAELEKELLSSAPGAQADEKPVLRLAAHDAMLSEILGDSQLQIAQRIQALIDNTKLVALLASALGDVTACRNAATRRVQDLLQASGTLRNQRDLSGILPLRRVA